MYRPFLLFYLGCFASSCNQNSAARPGKAVIKGGEPAAFEKQAVDLHAITPDELQSSPGNFKLLLDNKYVRVLEYHLDPGKKDNPHTHPAKSSYVVTGGKLKVYLENGSTIIADEEAGTASWSEAVGKHYVENIGTSPVTIVLTEIKSAQH